jgi:hypothetical protein
VALLALLVLGVFAVLVLIVLVNMLIAIVSETFKEVKRNEPMQMLRNKAYLISEIEGVMPPAARRVM